MRMAEQLPAFFAADYHLPPQACSSSSRNLSTIYSSVRVICSSSGSFVSYVCSTYLSSLVLVCSPIVWKNLVILLVSTPLSNRPATGAHHTLLGRCDPTLSPPDLISLPSGRIWR